MAIKYSGRKSLLKNRVFFFLCLLLFCACQSQTTKPVDDSNLNKKEIAIKVEEPVIEEKEIILPDGWSQINEQANIKLELKYATEDNFVKSVMYDCPTCWLRPEAKEALENVKTDLGEMGFGLVLYDCYRPRPVQQKLWDIMPNPSYVTPPKKGSMHNRGLAIDLGLIDGAGNIIDMGTEFDFFGPRAHHDYLDLDEVILKRRKLLKMAMEKHGFKGIRTEWWHYSYQKSRYPLSDELWPCDN